MTRLFTPIERDCLIAHPTETQVHLFDHPSLIMAAKDVLLVEQPSFVTLDNGIAKLTISRPGGFLTGLSYGGMANLLDLKSPDTSRGYWDLNWSSPGAQGARSQYELVKATQYTVIQKTKNCVELSFKRTMNAAANGGSALNIDKRFIMRSGVSGFYNYAIYDRPAGSPGFDLAQTRMVFVLNIDKFQFMAISDTKQRVMPLPGDIKLPNRCQKLIVDESVLLTNPVNPNLKGEVDDKYQYSMDNKDGGLHGWISSNPNIGFWIIIPSNESRNGGPTKQNLTCHVGPTCLAMFHSGHYIGNDMTCHFKQGEAWTKVLGPFFVYLNTARSPNNAAKTLWEDAKRQRMDEVKAWPYNFVSSPNFLPANKRGSASGKLLVQDKSPIPAKDAYVGLSLANTPGGWELESKGYQFWVKTGPDGSFNISNVVPGVYSLHGWVPGFIGDYFNAKPITISASGTQLGNLTFVPPRMGPTVWEIGFPDRTGLGFYVPDANPKYINKLFINSPEKFRQYGLWDRYTDIHPATDQVFRIGVDDAAKSWFFIHVCRLKGGKYLPTTWQVKFNLTAVIPGKYKLHIALAAANRLDLRVYMNVVDAKHQVFEILNLGNGNAICRHGIHGLYRLFSADIASSLLIKGENTMFLAQTRGGDALCGVLYDYLRLESPGAPKPDAPNILEEI